NIWMGNFSGAEDNILLTENDPLFQTQRLNLNTYKIDVPDGVYEVTFYFSDLLTTQNQEHLPYDMKQIKGINETSVFDLIVNDNVVRPNLNLRQEYGKLKAVQMKYRIRVENNKGIEISFNKISGTPMLNAISVKQK
ncbi:MAG: malectin domain-containing carbohydrate-binding protein, partial [Bacteroidota bacterium]